MTSYQRNVTSIRAHRCHPGILQIRGYSPQDPGAYLRRGHWRLQHPCPNPGGLPGHLPHEYHPLRQRQHAPLVESHRHRGRGNPSVAELLEAHEKDVEPLLLVRGGVPTPLHGALNHHPPGVLREQPAVIPEVEPSVLPPPVRRRHDAPDVQVGARLTELQRATASP